MFIKYDLIVGLVLRLLPNVCVEVLEQLLFCLY